jgi:predicted RND superfamily exporter protein
MAMLYESLRDPFIVMFSVPLAAIGVILTLFLTKTSFNMQSYIGLIMLGGIVVNNAIIIVDYTNLLRHRDKMPIREAIEEAGRRRLRPILMTAFTAVMATFPLALGLGEGGEAQAPLARTVIGGLLSSTLITLVVVPVVYNIFEDFRRKKRRAWPTGPPRRLRSSVARYASTPRGTRPCRGPLHGLLQHWPREGTAASDMSRYCPLFRFYFLPCGYHSFDLR